MGIIHFNGASSEKYGILVENPPGYSYPQKDVETLHIPGRNGDMYIDNDSYNNVDREYNIAFGDEVTSYVQQANKVSRWLHSAKGYARLEDSYEPNYFRLAAYNEEGSLSNILQHAGRATIKFNCKPQRYLKTGDDLRKFDLRAGIALLNPTDYVSYPEIIIGRDGSMMDNWELRIRNDHFGYICRLTMLEIKSIRGLTIDSDIQDVYQGTNNYNDRVIIVEGGFPKLYPGTNIITSSITVSNTYAEVRPRWWTL